MFFILAVLKLKLIMTGENAMDSKTLVNAGTHTHTRIQTYNKMYLDSY